MRWAEPYALRHTYAAAGSQITTTPLSEGEKSAAAGHNRRGVDTRRRSTRSIPWWYAVVWCSCGGHCSPVRVLVGKSYEEADDDALPCHCESKGRLIIARPPLFVRLPAAASGPPGFLGQGPGAQERPPGPVVWACERTQQRQVSVSHSPSTYVRCRLSDSVKSRSMYTVHAAQPAVDQRMQRSDPAPLNSTQNAAARARSVAASSAMERSRGTWRDVTWRLRVSVRPSPHHTQRRGKDWWGRRWKSISPGLKVARHLH
jgi:hypothetical protein